MDSGEFLKLLQNDFDEKVFVSKVFETNSLLENLKMVSGRLSELDVSISEHVSKHNNELLSQTAELENFSNIVGSVESRIKNISGNVNLIKQRISKHYNHLNTQVTLIRRLCLTYETLRSVLRVSLAIKDLHDSSTDIVHASECIEELIYTFNSLDWKGIQVLEDHYKTLCIEKNRVISEARKLIHSSFKNNDQGNLGIALQAFDNLSMLPKVVQALVSDWQTEIEAVVKVAADVEELNKRAKTKAISSLTSSIPGKASIPASGSHAAAFRNLLWKELDQMISVLDRCLSQVRILLDTLQKKRSSLSGSTSLADQLRNYVLKNITISEERDCCAAIVLVLYTDEVNRDKEPVMVHIRKLPQDTDAYMFEAYSDGLLGWFVTCLGALFEPALRRRSGQLKEAIESEYPRLLKLFLNISGRQQTLAKPVEAFLTPFETAYLGRCLTRLFDRVNSTFLGISASEGNGGNLPRLIDAERMVQTAATELAHSAAVQHELFCKVTRNVAKMVSLFSAKVEALIVTGPEASQVSVDGFPTSGQQKNAHLVNFTCAFADRLRTAVARHTTAQQQKWDARYAGGDDSQSIIDQAIVSELSNVCLAALEPLLKAITDHVVEKILPRIHLEISADGEDDPPFVRDLQAFIHRMRTEYLTGFSVSSGGSVSASRSTSSDKLLFNSGESALRAGLQVGVLPPCLDALAVHVSLLRPCTTVKQRSRLTSSAAAVEMILSTLAPPSRHTEAAFARLRSLRQLFALPEEDILSMARSQSSSTIPQRGTIGLGSSTDYIPGSLVLHHVIARGPEEIPLPHQTAGIGSGGWSLDRYVRWCLRQADEAARLTFVSRAMDVYVEGVETRQQHEYPEIYPLIRDLMELYQQGPQDRNEDL